MSLRPMCRVAVRSPTADRRQAERFGACHPEALLDEAELGRVVEGLRADPAAPAEGGQDEHGYPEPESDGPGEPVGVGGERLDGQVLTVGARRGDRRRDVVEEPVVLVVHVEQDRLRPHVGIGHQGPEDLVGEPLAQEGRGRRVLVVADRGADPAHLGQRSRLHVGGEVVGEGLGRKAFWYSGEDGFSVLGEVRKHAVGGETDLAAWSRCCRAGPGGL